MRLFAANSMRNTSVKPAVSGTLLPIIMLPLNPYSTWTGRQWAAATTEGLLLYGLDEGARFDPTDLGEEVRVCILPTRQIIAASTTY